MALTIPGSCLHERDHLNMRYMDRRALYLGAIARELSRDAHSAWVEAVLWERLAGDERKPCLVIVPGTRARVRCVPRRGAPRPL